MEAITPMASVESPLAIGNFPTELAFDIIDILFMQGPRLIHDGLCSLRCLSLVDKSSALVVKSYLRLRLPSQRLSKALSFQWSSYATERSRLHSGGPHLTGLPGSPMLHPSDRNAEEDILTSIILDGCSDCFDWFCKRNPGIHRTSCNQHGWSYIGLAIYAGAAHTLEYFLRSPISPDDFVFSLIQHFPACAYKHGPSHLDLMTQKRDLRGITGVVDVLEPFFQDPFSQLNGANLKPEAQYNLCSFVTPSLAKRLQENFSMPVVENSTFDTPLWHAAVINGPQFMEYLRSHGQESSQTLTQFYEGRTPLGLAVDMDRVESARWLVNNYTSFDEKDRQCFEIDLCDEIKIAAMSSSAISAQFLEVFLSITPSYHKIKDLPLSLLTRLVVSLHNEILDRRLSSNWDERKLLRFQEEQEPPAIKKCNAILKAAQVGGGFCLKHRAGLEESNTDTRTRCLSTMVRLLEKLGFEKLSLAIWGTCYCSH